MQIYIAHSTTDATWNIILNMFVGYVRLGTCYPSKYYFSKRGRLRSKHSTVFLMNIRSSFDQKGKRNLWKSRFCQYFCAKLQHLVFVCELLCQSEVNKFPGVCRSQNLGSSNQMDKSVLCCVCSEFYFMTKAMMQSWTLIIVI